MEKVNIFWKGLAKVLKNINLQYIIYTIKIRYIIFGGTKEMATRNKSVWVLVLFMLAGIVLGGLIGELASSFDFLWWLGYGQSFGLSNPLTLNLSIISITFGLEFKINIASIIGIGIALFIYRKT